jgi:hypothetical protein
VIKRIAFLGTAAVLVASFAMTTIANGRALGTGTTPPTRRVRIQTSQTR